MPGFQNLPSTTESPLTEPGLIHMDIVMALPEMSSEAELAIDRWSLIPSKLRPFPYFPTTRAGPFTSVAVLPFPEASAEVVPLPSLKPHAATGPGGADAVV